MSKIMDLSNEPDESLLSSINEAECSMLDERLYYDRLENLGNQLSKLDLKSLEIKDSDLFDQFCDPQKPVKIQFNDISAAAYRIKGSIEQTPCTKSTSLSNLTGMEIYLKKEFQQITGSFKERGARYALLNLSKAQKLYGVIAASAGNHALALCYHGKNLNIPVVVVMPRIAPITKVSNCRNYGAVVLIEGESINDAKQIALKLSKTHGLNYINGYDHPNILAGQGTMALEIIEQVPDVHAIIIPTGGGGLLAGIAVAVKAMNPNILIISVESEKCASFHNSLKNGRPTFTKAESTLADGLAVPLVGFNSFATAAPLVDKSVLVSEQYIAIAILRLLELERSVVEGAGASGLASLLQGLLPDLKGKKVVIPLCGANIDISTLGRVVERALAADGRLIKLCVTISDRPGGLAEFCHLISSMGASIKDIYHERAWLRSDIFSVQVQAVLEVENEESAKEIEKIIAEKYENVEVSKGGIHSFS